MMNPPEDPDKDQRGGEKQRIASSESHGLNKQHSEHEKEGNEKKSKSTTTGAKKG